METTTPTPQRCTSTLTGIAPRDVLQKMLDTLGVPAKVEEQTVNGAMRLFVATPEPARLIGKRGQTIYQLQFLLNRMLQRANPDLPRIPVDCERKPQEPQQERPQERPQERRFDELLKQVNVSAEKVRRWGDPVVVGPFDSSERDAVHQHFERDAELEVLNEPGDDNGRKRIMIRVRTGKSRA